MTGYQFFAAYWWLIFPVGGMLMGLIGMMNNHRQRTETLKMLKSYADQGKEPPQFLLDTLKDDDGYSYRGGRKRSERPWWGIMVFGPLALGFGYVGYNADGGDEAMIFTALAMGFGAAAILTLVYSLISLAFEPKKSDQNADNRDRVDD